jgi:hypothetical protein
MAHVEAVIVKSLAEQNHLKACAVSMFIIMVNNNLFLTIGMLD